MNDELPFTLHTDAGDLANVPLNHELSDRQIITIQQQSADSYAEQQQDAFQWLAAEAATTGSARVLPLHVTPYIMGLPYRIGALEGLLGWLAGRAENTFLTPAAVLDGWREGSA